MQTNESTFCAICRHPTGEGDGHFKNCPVYTGEPVRGVLQSDQQGFQEGTIFPGYPLPMQINPQSLQPYHPQQTLEGWQLPQHGGVICPYCGGMNGVHVWAGEGGCPATRQHHPSYQEGAGYIAELKSLTESNRRLSKELMDALAEVARLKEAK